MFNVFIIVKGSRLQGQAVFQSNLIHEIFFSSFSFELNNERSNHWLHRPEVKVMQLWTSTAECYERSLLFKLIIDASNQSWQESEFKLWHLWYLNKPSFSTRGGFIVMAEEV